MGKLDATSSTTLSSTAHATPAAGGAEAKTEVEITPTGSSSQPAVTADASTSDEQARALAIVGGDSAGTDIRRGGRGPAIEPAAGTGGFTVGGGSPPTKPSAPAEPTPNPTGRPPDVPETLMRTENATVVNGDTESAGDYYCEHALFVGLREANREGSSVVRNEHGEPLVGFLHVPSDPHTDTTGDTYPQEERHRGTREVIGAAIRGYVDQAAARVNTGPVKILITGYETFGWVRNNPTGEFVSRRENIDAAMAHAFGDNLMTPYGDIVAGGDGTAGSRVLSYVVRIGDDRYVEVRTESLPVDDTAINPGERDSLIGALESFRPHAVISMGVAGMPPFRAEYHADSGGLLLSDDGTVRHGYTGNNSGAVSAQPHNFSLARAIYAGKR